MPIAPSESNPGHVDEPAGVISTAQLAHELNSLLDGSMRCLRLAGGRLLNEAHETGSPEVLSHLQLAHEAMTRMSELLTRAMSGEGPAQSVLSSGEDLGASTARIMALLRPLAEERGVALGWSVAEGARDLPTGAIGSIIFNGMSNAIEAAASGATKEALVDLSVTMTADRHLKICIADSGPGFSPADLAARKSGRAGRHGIGLPLCQQLVTELGGVLQLATAPSGEGTVLMVLLPVAGDGRG